MSGAPAASGTRYDSLDIWRGVACLLVLLNHAVFYQGDGSKSSLDALYMHVSGAASFLWTGVPIFFVISGYCIAASADSHRRKHSPVSQFFFKRFRRIFPPYWVVLLVAASTLAVSDLLLGGAMTTHTGLLRPWWYSSWQWFGTVTLTETWRYHILGGQKALYLGHAWTLCYEEQFYAVCGLLLAVAPRHFFRGTALVTVATLLIATAAQRLGLGIDGFFFDGRWLQFAFGVGVYYALNRGGSRSRWCLAVMLGSLVLWTSAHGAALLLEAHKGTLEYGVAAGFALVALLLRPFDRALSEHAALAPVRLCGVMCYSLYLVHLPAINLMRAATVAAGADPGRLSPLLTVSLFGGVSICLAWLFHLTVERRFMTAPSPTVPYQALASAR